MGWMVGGGCSGDAVTWGAVSVRRRAEGDMLSKQHRQRCHRSHRFSARAVVLTLLPAASMLIGTSDAVFRRPGSSAAAAALEADEAQLLQVVSCIAAYAGARPDDAGCCILISNLETALGSRPLWPAMTSEQCAKRLRCTIRWFCDCCRQMIVVGGKRVTSTWPSRGDAPLCWLQRGVRQVGRTPRPPPGSVAAPRHQALGRHRLASGAWRELETAAEATWLAASWPAPS